MLEVSLGTFAQSLWKQQRRDTGRQDHTSNPVAHDGSEELTAYLKTTGRASGSKDYNFGLMAASISTALFQLQYVLISQLV